MTDQRLSSDRFPGKFDGTDSSSGEPYFPVEEELVQSADDQPDALEQLVPRLGDYLLEQNLIGPEQLESALEYQKAYVKVGKPRLLGQILVELGILDRQTLDAIISKQILTLQAALKSANFQLEERVRERTADVERRLLQIHTSAEVAQAAISAQNLEELLQKTVNLIFDRFGYYHAAIFLLDETGSYAILREATGSIGEELKRRQYKLAVGSTSVVGWVTKNNQPRIVSEVNSEPSYLQDELLPNTHSEICIPLSINSQVLGALDIQTVEKNAFSSDDLMVLQTLTNQIASGVQILRSLETTQVNLHQLNLLHQASTKIAHAQTPQEVIKQTALALQNSPFVSAILLVSYSELRVVAITDPQIKAGTPPVLNRILTVRLSEVEAAFPRNRSYSLVGMAHTENIPIELMNLPRKLGCFQAAFLPIWRADRIAAVCMLGAREPDTITPADIQPYLNMLEFTTTALEKINALDSTQQRMKNLEIINKVSQVIASETNLDRLYQTIHHQITDVMGETTFYIALYDHENNLIHFPYLFEDGQLTRLAPIPLGEGLTSVVIHGKKPLMLVEDTENKAIALGAKQMGKIARSWLGVPLLLADEVIGVMAVQNAEQENFFDEDDQRLLSTLALQVAVAIRNAQLITKNQRKAELERRLFDVSEKIRQSIDIETILATTATELGKVLGVHKASIKIELPTNMHQQSLGTLDPGYHQEPME